MYICKNTIFNDEKRKNFRFVSYVNLNMHIPICNLQLFHHSYIKY